MTLHEVLSPLVPLLAEAVATIAGLAALSLVGWLRARFKNKIAADALALVATNAATLVRGAADEVRRRKDRNNKAAGEWTADDSRALRDRVVGDLARTSAGAIEHLRRTQRLDAEGVRVLLEQAVEAEVEKLRHEGEPEKRLSSEDIVGLVSVLLSSPAGLALSERLFGVAKPDSKPVAAPPEATDSAPAPAAGDAP